MESSVELSPETVLKSLQDFISLMTQTTESIEESIREIGMEDFQENHLKMFFSLFQAYQMLWKSFGSTSKEIFLETIKKLSVSHRGNASVQDALEDFLQTEQRWDEFMEGLDTRLNRPLDNVALGKDFKLEVLESPGTEVEFFKDVIGASELTWVVFLRHFS